MKPGAMTNHLRRLPVTNNEPLRIALRYLAKTKTVPDRVRTLAYFRLWSLPANTSPHRIHECCFLTGANRAVVREFGVSRIVFHRMALAGNVTWLRNACW